MYTRGYYKPEHQGAADTISTSPVGIYGASCNGAASADTGKLFSTSGAQHRGAVECWGRPVDSDNHAEPASGSKFTGRKPAPTTAAVAKAARTHGK